MNNEINPINNYKKILISLLTVPLILIGCIYISYGETLDGIVIQQSEYLKFYQLQVQLSIFSGDVFQVPLSYLPQVTASIGYYSVIAIYIIFFVWLVLFATSSYLQLSQRSGSKISILVELSIIFTIYIVSISPKMNLWISIFGYFIIAIVFVMLLLYSMYEIKSR